MIHDLSPFLIRIYGDLGVRWYGLSYFLGFLLSYLLILWLKEKQRTTFSSERVLDFVVVSSLGTLIGGRLGYCLFYDPELFFRFKSSFPFWGVFAVNEGGMASHGGILGLAVSCTWFAHRWGMSRLYLFDLVGVCGPIGLFIGRIANFLNGELVGRPCPPDFPLGVKFPTDIFFWPKFESQRLSGLGTVFDQVPGWTAGRWNDVLARWKQGDQNSIQDALANIVDQIQNGNAGAKNALAPLLTLRHPSQLYAAAGEGLLLFLILWIYWRRPRNAGTVGALFLVCYGIIRVVVEQFRNPDPEMGLQLFDFTRGQWLSLAMIGVGVVLFFVWTGAGSIAIPGWGREQTIRLNRRF